MFRKKRFFSTKNRFLTNYSPRAAKVGVFLGKLTEKCENVFFSFFPFSRPSELWVYVSRNPHAGDAGIPVTLLGEITFCQVDSKFFQKSDYSVTMIESSKNTH